MKHSRPRSIVIAIVVGMVSIAPLSAVGENFSCTIEGKSIPVESSGGLKGLVEARLVDGQPKILLDKEKLALTYFSDVTVQFLFQRQCARIQLGRVGKQDVIWQEEADCAAIGNLGLSLRQVETIVRDLELAAEEGDWPSSMGDERPLDLESCLD